MNNIFNILIAVVLVSAAAIFMLTTSQNCNSTFFTQSINKLSITEAMLKVETQENLRSNLNSTYYQIENLFKGIFNNDCIKSYTLNIKIYNETTKTSISNLKQLDFFSSEIWNELTNNSTMTVFDFDVSGTFIMKSNGNQIPYNKRFKLRVSFLPPVNFDEFNTNYISPNLRSPKKREVSSVADKELLLDSSFINYFSDIYDELLSISNISKDNDGHSFKINYDIKAISGNLQNDIFSKAIAQDFYNKVANTALSDKLKNLKILLKVKISVEETNTKTSHIFNYTFVFSINSITFSSLQTADILFNNRKVISDIQASDKDVFIPIKIDAQDKYGYEIPDNNLIVSTDNSLISVTATYLIVHSPKKIGNYDFEVILKSSPNEKGLIKHYSFNVVPGEAYSIRKTEIFYKDPHLDMFDDITNSCENYPIFPDGFLKFKFYAVDKYGNPAKNGDIKVSFTYKDGSTKTISLNSQMKTAPIGLDRKIGTLKIAVFVQDNLYKVYNLFIKAIPTTIELPKTIFNYGNSLFTKPVPVSVKDNFGNKFTDLNLDLEIVDKDHALSKSGYFISNHKNVLKLFVKANTQIPSFYTGIIPVYLKVSVEASGIYARFLKKIPPVYIKTERSEKFPFNDRLDLSLISDKDLTPTLAYEEIYPILSPDGRMVSFERLDKDGLTLWIKYLNTGREIQIGKKMRIKKKKHSLQQKVNRIVLGSSWNINGNELYLSYSKGQNYDIYRYDIDSNKLYQLYTESSQDLHPTISPNNQLLAWTSNGKLMLAKIDDSGNLIKDTIMTVNSNPYNDNLVWSPNGRFLAYVSRDNDTYDIYVYDVTLKQNKKITHDSNLEKNLFWSPDSKNIGYIASVDNSNYIFAICNFEGKSSILIKDKYSFKDKAVEDIYGRRITLPSESGKFLWPTRYDIIFPSKYPNELMCLKLKENYNIGDKNIIEKVYSIEDNLGFYSDLNIVSDREYGKFKLIFSAFTRSSDIYEATFEAK